MFAPEGLMLDLDRCMLVDHRAGESMKTKAGESLQKAAILDGRQKYDLNWKR